MPCPLRRFVRSVPVRLLVAVAGLLLALGPAWGGMHGMAPMSGRAQHAGHERHPPHATRHCHDAGSPAAAGHACCDPHADRCVGYACTCGAGCSSLPTMLASSDPAPAVRAIAPWPSHGTGVPRRATSPPLRPPAA